MSTPQTTTIVIKARRKGYTFGVANFAIEKEFAKILNIKKDMEKIQTAEEFNLEKLLDSSHRWNHKEIMIEFAKLHVEAALKAAAENVQTNYFYTEDDPIDKDSILNSYSPNLIK
jgi:hypothetical protein